MMSMSDSFNKNEMFKLPRLFVKEPLSLNRGIELESGQAHYLRNVLRRKEGDFVRLFNGIDGEWIGAMSYPDKKQAIVNLAEQLLKQPAETRRTHLLFTPIKKNRMDWLIEKAVELGATDFHPVLTQNTEVRKIKEERLEHQIFEAAEQCERFEIPKLHTLQKLEQLLSTWPENIPVLSCLERFDAPVIQEYAKQEQDIAFLIGPEGGFTEEEKQKIASKTTPVSLGNTILRCETAAAKALILLSA